MALQKKVYQAVRPALPGQLATAVNDDHFTSLTAQSTAPVVVGNFVFSDPAIPGNVLAAKQSGAELRGIVVRSISYPDPTNGEAASMQVPAGYGLNVLEQGSIWVNCEAGGAKVGMDIYAKEADGTPVASSTTVEGAVKSNFVVQFVYDDGKLCLISNRKVF